MATKVRRIKPIEGIWEERLRKAGQFLLAWFILTAVIYFLVDVWAWLFILRFGLS